MKTKKQNTHKLRAVALAIAALVCGMAAVYLLFFYNKDAYERQDMEESIADDFIADLIKSAIEENGKEGEEEDDANTIRIDLNIEERPEKDAGTKSINQWRDERSEYASYKRDLLSDEPEGL